MRQTVTERTFYAAMIDVIRAVGGEGVQETQFNSAPDIIFQLGQRQWILSVKIGDDLATIKGAFLQYLRHKEESGIPFGMLVMLPNTVRRIVPDAASIAAAIATSPCTSFVDAGDVKEELRDRPFPEIIDFLQEQVLPKIQRGEQSNFRLSTVISLLQQHVTEMMAELNLGETEILRIIADRQLFMEIGHLTANQVEQVGRFLAAFILMSQILFLRLLIAARPQIIPFALTPATHQRLRRAFRKVLEINYRPIYELDVLDSIPREFLRDTFDLIWGLQLERVRYELPGRIFHELMPHVIRKMLAAFYTRPQAAHLLANLTILDSTATVFDPACGSGTLLTAAYRRKSELFTAQGHAGNPHQRFTEDEIFGADIMPFAVHLTAANLAATDAAETIDRTQIIQGNSLDLKADTTYQGGLHLQGQLFAAAPRAATAAGDMYEVPLHSVDAVLMNPPFTKIERGIRNFVDMRRFADGVGGEVGLWGHFLALAHVFMREGGRFGGVIPINILRGRESARVRRLLFQEWTPLYVLKPTKNYGFSEWSEYRDILFIAEKRQAPANHRVKFGLVKKDLVHLNDEDIAQIETLLATNASLRSNPLVDIESFPTSELLARFDNLMWFCGVTDFRHRDTLVTFLARFQDRVERFPANHFREGFRPVPAGVSNFLFVTRASHSARIERAFLRFENEGDGILRATSEMGQATYEIDLEQLTPTLRTSVGVRCMDITGRHDYIAHTRYPELPRVCRSAGVPMPRPAYWEGVQRSLDTVSTHLVVSHRINPFSPATYLNAFVSDEAFSPSNTMNVIVERDLPRAKALCTLLNSIVFFAQFFLLKEESTGRYINIRFYDMEQMDIYPSAHVVPLLLEVFERFRSTEFPSLREQFDASFDLRFQEFWERERESQQPRLFTVLDRPIEPNADRLRFDREVCHAIGVPVTDEELTAIYSILVTEMIITKGLQRD